MKKKFKGFKKCPSCNKKNHPRVGLCKCGHEFIPGFAARQNKVKVVEVYKERGRGKKRCGGPGEPHFVGLRVEICPQCGFDFSKVEKKIPVKEQVDEEAIKYRAMLGFQHITLVYAPVGSPAKPKDIDDISDWIDKNVVWDGKLIHTSALKYWLRQMYGYGTEEYKTVAKQVDKWRSKIQKDYETENKSK